MENVLSVVENLPGKKINAKILFSIVVMLVKIVNGNIVVVVSKKVC
jgi:hypothetical protein